MKRARDSQQKEAAWTKELETLIDKIGKTKDTRLDKLIETLVKKWSQEEKSTNTRFFTNNVTVFSWRRCWFRLSVRRMFCLGKNDLVAVLAGFL